MSGTANIYTLHLVGSGLKVFVKGSQEELLSTNVLKVLARAHSAEAESCCLTALRSPRGLFTVQLGYVMLGQVRLERAPLLFQAQQEITRWVYQHVSKQVIVLHLSSL